MSFISKLFGGSFEEHFTEGARLFDAGSFGPAKLRLEKAIGKSKGAPAEEVTRARELIRACRRALAKARIADADNAAASGELEDAMQLLRDAAEICDDEKITSLISDRAKAFDAMDVRSLVEEVDHIDDDELLTILAGTWSDDQAEEYAALPESFRDGLLAAHDGRHEVAVEVFRGISAQTDAAAKPRYLYWETAKSLAALKQDADALEMLDAFLAATEDDDRATEGRLVALDMKAAALAKMERFEEAETALRQAVREAPEDHTVFLKLGVFLRGQKKLDQSERVLEKSRELMGQMQPDITVIRELGFTYLAMERKKEAMECFGGVVEHLASRGQHSEFEPLTTTTLAALYEERGEFLKAADLYRHLSVGYDTKSYFVYNFQAARLLRLAGAEPALVDKYLSRARELAASKADTAMLSELEAECRPPDIGGVTC